MKKYVYAILISCLSLHLCSCYSYKYINKDQIDYYYPDEPITIKTVDKTEFVVKKDVSIEEIENNPKVVFCTQYEINDNNIHLLKKKVVFINQIDNNGLPVRAIMSEAIIIPSDLVTEIGSYEFDWLTTCTLTVSAIGIIWLVALASTFHL